MRFHFCIGAKWLPRASKSLLPTYDVFDEARYFEPATENTPVDFNGHSLGLTVCEDVWNDEDFLVRPSLPEPIPWRPWWSRAQKMILNVSASPWHLGKHRMRADMLASLAAKVSRPLLYWQCRGRK